LREITEQYAGDWEQTYEDALAESEMTEEDETYLQSEVKEAGGSRRSSSATYKDCRKLLPIKKTGGPAARMSHQDLTCGIVAGLIAGGVMIGNLFCFGFAVGMPRKAGCW
jgi:hypothetical protein